VVGRDLFNNASSLSTTIEVDRTNPTMTIGTTGPNAYLSGTQLYYRASGGTFGLTATVTDSGTGPGSARFPDIATWLWTHADETQTVETGGTIPTLTYTSSPFSWPSGGGVPGLYTVIGKDKAGNQATSSITTFTADGTSPSGGAMSVNGVTATT